MKAVVFLLTLVLTSCVSSARSPTLEPEHLHLAVPSGELLDYLRYAAQGDVRVVWVSSERGQAEAELAAARELAKRGVEVWMVDLTFSYVLDLGRKGLDRVPPEDIRALLNRAGVHKKVVVVALGRAAVPLLAAYGTWRPEEGRPRKLEFVLVHPNLYEQAEPFQDARYLELGNLEGAWLLILQPRRSAGFVWLDQQGEALRKHGASVQNEVLERVREGFWARQDATAHEIEVSQRFGELIWDGLARMKQE